MKKTLSLILAILMIISTMPLVFAEEQIQLSVDNMVELPTIEGEIFYGQTIAESTLTFVGGKVTSDGTTESAVIDGYFEFIDTTVRPKNGEVAQIKFVPANDEVYTGFETLDSEITVPVSKATPIYESLPTVEKAAAVNKRLSTVTLTTIGKFYNPYTHEEIEGAKWYWAKSSTKVSAPGLYPIKAGYSSLNNSNYEVLDSSVWVGIEGYDDSLFPTIKEYPTFTETVRYDPSKTWGDLTLTGGKAVVYDSEGNEIEAQGTFTVSDAFLTAPINKLGNNNITLQFTSADEAVAVSIPVILSVTVEKGTPAWKDSQTPVVTVSYGIAIKGTIDIDNKLLNAYNETYPSGWHFGLYDLNMNKLTERFVPDCGTYNYLVNPSSAFTPVKENWETEGVYLPVTLVVVPGKAEITASYNERTNKISASATASYLYGTFDIYIDGELAFDDVTAKNFEAEWTPADTSKDSVHTLKVVYNKADNDNAVIENAYESTFNFKAIREISVGTKNNSIKVPAGSYNPDENNTAWGTRKLYAGDEVKIIAGLPDFRYWVIKDMNGNEVDLGIDKNSNIVTFIMPDYDISIDYVCQFELDAIAEKEEAIDNCKCLCHDSDNEFVQFFWNVFVTIIDILENLFGTEILCECGYDHCA